MFFKFLIFSLNLALLICNGQHLTKDFELPIFRNEIQFHLLYLYYSFLHNIDYIKIF